MNITIKQVRDLDLIEKELNSGQAGIFACIANEKVCQAAATYIYRNKNVYVFLNESEDIYLNIKLDTEARFTISHFHYKRTSQKTENPDVYCLLSVSVSGTANNLTDQKLIEDVTGDYLLKYGRAGSSENAILPAVKIIFIDSKEIQAFEQTGS